MAFLLIFWAFLNVAALIGLLILFRFLSKRFGSLKIGVSLVVLVTMCQSVTKQSTNKSKSTRFQTILFLPNLPDNKLRSHYLTLADLTTCDINQTIYMTRKGQPDSIQIDSPIFMTGFVGGLLWSSVSTQVRVQSNQRLYYSTLGILEWRLLGLPVYKQPRQFDGYITL